MMARRKRNRERTLYCWNKAMMGVCKECNGVLDESWSWRGRLLRSAEWRCVGAAFCQSGR